MSAPSPAELIAKFVALIANLRASKESLERVVQEHPLPDINTIRMGLQRQLSCCSWAPYTEAGHYYVSNYPKGSAERTYAENFMAQRKAREPVNRIAYWIREFYRLQKMLRNGATESQFRMYSTNESIDNLAQLLEINVSQEESFDLVMAIASTPFDWKAHGINTDEYDEEDRRNLEFLENYNAGILTAPKMLPMLPL